MTSFKVAPADWPLPMWIAHRGAGKLAPENTLAAFREGARYGYSAFECDVKLSADDVPFLLHDATLDRTTPQRGLAKQHPWHHLSQVDAGGWHSRAYAGEPLPSLQAIATFLRRNGFGLDLEIKPTPGDEAHTGRLVAQAVAQFWAGATPAQTPVLSSFQPEALQATQATAPYLPRALLVDTLWDGWWPTAQALDCAAVITNNALMDPALISQLHAAGMRALVYTVNDEAEVQRLLRLGIDGIITDAVDRFSAVAAESGSQR